MKYALLIGAFLAQPAAQAAPPVNAMLGIAANAPAVMIPAHTAQLMKRELDSHTLFVDVDAAADPEQTMRIDAHVPLRRYDAPETFDQTFIGGMDHALAAKGLRHTDGVVIVSSSPRIALQAAELMKEYGYTLLFAVTPP